MGCFTEPIAKFKQEPLDENGTQIGGPGTTKVTFDTGGGKLLCKGEQENAQKRKRSRHLRR